MEELTGSVYLQEHSQEPHSQEEGEEEEEDGPQLVA